MTTRTSFLEKLKLNKILTLKPSKVDRIVCFSFFDLCLRVDQLAQFKPQANDDDDIPDLVPSSGAQVEEVKEGTFSF